MNNSDISTTSNSTTNAAQYQPSQTIASSECQNSLPIVPYIPENRDTTIKNKISRNENVEDTLLHKAARNGSCNLIESLLGKFQINAKNKLGQTPLHVAILSGKAEFVKEILEEGADLNLTVQVGETRLDALGLATMFGEKECLEAIIKSKNFKIESLKSKYDNLGSLLHVAIYFHQVDLLHHLLRNYLNKVDLESKNNDKLSPLAFAASLGEDDCISLLHYFGASLECKGFLDRTPLHYAALNCHADTIKLLVTLGSNVNAVSDHGTKLPIGLIEEGKSNAKICSNILMNLSAKQQKTFLSKIAFEGGGAKGLAYMGALKALDQKQLLDRVDQVAGTSAGAITAAFVSMNYSISGLEDLLRKTDLYDLLMDHMFTKEALFNFKDLKSAFKTFNEKIYPLYQKILSAWNIYQNPTDLSSLKDYMNIAKSFYSLNEFTGLCEGEKFREWLEAQISEISGKEFFTFGELRKAIKTGKLNKQGRPFRHLHIYTSKVGDNPELVHISSEDKNWDNVIISDAVCCSMAIPLFFKPRNLFVKINGQRNRAEELGSFLDGFLLNNFPIKTFDKKRYLSREDLGKEGDREKTNKQTLGFCLFSSLESEPITTNINSASDLLKGIGNIYWKAQQLCRKHETYDNANRTIEIDTLDVGTTDFGIPASKQEELINSGNKSTTNHLNKHSFAQLPPLPKEYLSPFLYFASKGDLEKLKLLYKQKPELIHKRSANGSTALIVAARYGQIEIIRFLLEEDPSLIYKYDDQNDTAFHAATWGGHIEAMELLYNADCSLIEKFTNHGESSIYFAILSDDVKVMEWLSKKDLNLLAKIRKRTFTQTTSLMWAAGHGKLESVKFLLRLDPTLFSEDTKGLNFLHYAAHFGKVEILEHFYNIDPSLISKSQENVASPLHFLVGQGHLEAIKVFLRKDPALISTMMDNGRTLLHLAAEAGQVEIMKFLCKNDPTLISKFTKDGETPLHTAAKFGKVKAMKYLLKQDRTLISKFVEGGLTPFHAAAALGQVEAMQFLYKEDPTLISRTTFSPTKNCPLVFAAFGGHIAAGKWLLEQKNPGLPIWENDFKFFEAVLDRISRFAKENNHVEFAIWIQAVSDEYSSKELKKLPEKYVSKDNPKNESCIVS